jgi:photosystem II stability/assembly factor-like uncharacterized protein
MRQPHILLILVSLTLMTGCAPSTAEANTGTWEIVHQTEVSMRAFTAAFLDDEFGLTVGHAGDPLYTTDGGQTWVSGENVSLDLDGLDIVDENVIWASGRNVQVRVSVDGGQTWQAASSISDGTTAPYISFLDAQIGWVATRNSRRLWTTADAGQTWTEIAPPEELVTLAGISLRTEMDGYLLDDTGMLYITQDGGQSWSSQPLGLGGKVVTAYELPLTAMRFTDTDHGIVVLSLEGGGGKAVVLRTNDGGKTWEQEDAPVPTGTLHLTHDGETLTAIDRPAGQIVVLRHKDG